ncbi:MAG: hypothetical protein KBT27_13050 [Prevotellaceae bacterium]|nr:hypothetical protein [Candidatus Faecinaster equi]
MDNELKNKDLEQINGGTFGMNEKDVDKLNKGICCKCDGILIFKTQHGDDMFFICKNCETKYLCIGSNHWVIVPTIPE